MGSDNRVLELQKISEECATGTSSQEERQQTLLELLQTSHKRVKAASERQRFQPENDAGAEEEEEFLSRCAATPVQLQGSSQIWAEVHELQQRCWQNLQGQLAQPSSPEAPGQGLRSLHMGDIACTSVFVDAPLACFQSSEPQMGVAWGS